MRCLVQVLCVDGGYGAAPAPTPGSGCLSLDGGLSVTAGESVNGILMALCGTLLRIYWLLYMSITCQTAHPPARWWCHISLRHFCWGAVVSRSGGLDPVQVHQTARRTFISWHCPANVTRARLSHANHVVRKPGLGHSGGLRRRKTGGFLTAVLMLLAKHRAC